MRVRMLRAAREEFTRAISYYDSNRDGLGDAFVREVAQAVERMRKWPRAWPKVSKKSRKCSLNRFPYGLIYQQLSDEIRILAVMDLRRRPGYWKNREG
jgi:hypothetical protein